MIFFDIAVDAVVGVAVGIGVVAGVAVEVAVGGCSLLSVLCRCWWLC